MRVIKVQLEGFNGPTVYTEDEIPDILKEIEELLREGDIGQKITISQEEMDEEEFNDMEDFAGL